MPPKPTKRVTRSASGGSSQQNAKKRRTDPALSSQPTVPVTAISHDTIQSIAKAVSESITQQLSMTLTASSSGPVAQQPSSSNQAQQTSSSSAVQQPNSGTAAQQPSSGTVAEQPNS